MNVLFLSPHFPDNFRYFCAALRRAGANVLGIADTPEHALHPELRAALTDYYRVPDLHDGDALLRAVAWLVHRHGRIDRIESLNEYWLETEARLRADFNVPGPKPEDLPAAKRKSRMKEVFRQAGVAVARGCVVRAGAAGASDAPSDAPSDVEGARALAAEAGFPLVAKPDAGVGAAATWRIESADALERFLRERPAVDYLLEEFVRGDIYTWDGLVDREGRLVFRGSLAYSRGIMESVNEAADIYYYTLRDIPADLEDAGRRTLAAYGLRERFFHFEYFRRASDGQLVALEVNLRPPGGWTIDMYDHAGDIDLYRAWAEVLVHGRAAVTSERPYHYLYASRRHGRRYAHAPEVAWDRFGARLLRREELPPVFRAALGDEGWLARTPELGELKELAGFLHAPA